MPIITFILPDGSRRNVDAEAGDTAMRAAVLNDIPGIDAECGGACACATCHVHVETEHALAPVSPIEDAMLDATLSPRGPRSRLACQITLSEALDGLALRIPEATA